MRFVTLSFERRDLFIWLRQSLGSGENIKPPTSLGTCIRHWQRGVPLTVATLTMQLLPMVTTANGYNSTTIALTLFYLWALYDNSNGHVQPDLIRLD